VTRFASTLKSASILSAKTRRLCRSLRLPKSRSRRGGLSPDAAKAKTWPTDLRSPAARFERSVADGGVPPLPAARVSTRRFPRSLRARTPRGGLPELATGPAERCATSDPRPRPNTDNHARLLMAFSEDGARGNVAVWTKCYATEAWRYALHCLRRSLKRCANPDHGRRQDRRVFIGVTATECQPRHPHRKPAMIRGPSAALLISTAS